MIVLKISVCRSVRSFLNGAWARQNRWLAQGPDLVSGVFFLSSSLLLGSFVFLEHSGQATLTMSLAKSLASLHRSIAVVFLFA